LFNNTNLWNTSPDFCQLLSKLGTVVDIKRYPHIMQYLQKSHCDLKGNTDFPESFTIDGIKSCLQWIDNSNQVEMLFCMPTEPSRGSDEINLSAPSISKFANSAQAQNSSTVKSDVHFHICRENSAQKSNRTRSTLSSTSSEQNNEASSDQSKHLLPKRSSDLKIFAVWLERFEDMFSFPYVDLLQYTITQKPAAQRNSQTLPNSSDHIIFYLSQFEKGLIRVQVDGVWTKYGRPGPLVDGSVVSIDLLGDMLRQTVGNIARRKLFEVENNQMVHHKRRQAIIEIGDKFSQKDVSYSAFGWTPHK